MPLIHMATLHILSRAHYQEQWLVVFANSMHAVAAAVLAVIATRVLCINMSVVLTKLACLPQLQFKDQLIF